MTNWLALAVGVIGLLLVWYVLPYYFGPEKERDKVMAWLDKFRRKCLRCGRPQSSCACIALVVDGRQEYVSEGARQQAAVNMRLDPKLKERLIAMKGEAWCRRHYPEGFQQ